MSNRQILMAESQASRIVFLYPLDGLGNLLRRTQPILCSALEADFFHYSEVEGGWKMGLQIFDGATTLPQTPVVPESLIPHNVHLLTFLPGEDAFDANAHYYPILAFSGTTCSVGQVEKPPSQGSDQPDDPVPAASLSYAANFQRDSGRNG